MVRLAFALALGCAFLFSPSARATTVLTPSFDELVAEAELIFTGRVTAQHAEWRQVGGKRSIVTLVIFEVLDVLKGKSGRTIELQFLGGRIGDAELRVDLMPKFVIGDRAVLFVEKNGAQASPLVGFCHGKFGVLSDDSIITNEGAPVTDVNELGKPRARRDGARALSRREFTEKVRVAAQKGNR
jgi:hypothetical protein